MQRLLVLAALAGPCSADLASYVLPLTGTDGGGNMFPGATEPFGMVKLGPDMDSGKGNGGTSYSGYRGGAAYFTGFSLLHESGTGGAPKYGVVSQMPVAGAVADPLVRLADARDGTDTASPGSYTARLASGITVDLAATAHAGLLQYQFPENATNAVNSVVVDVSHVLEAPDRRAWSQRYVGGNLTVSSVDGRPRYRGSGTYDNGWNVSPPWTVYFCGHFDATGNATLFSAYDGGTGHAGAVFGFPSTQSTVVSRVGVSFVSEEQACASVDREIPEGTTHAAVAAQTRALWNSEVLGTITTTDKNTTRLQMLYTALYGMLLLPQNKTGENPHWSSAEPYYDDIFTLWDLFRCTTPLLQVLQPRMYGEFLRSLVDVWRHEGFLPDARSSFHSGATQGGSNADNVLADAFVKGFEGGVDWDDAYAAMQTDAETVPPNNRDARDPTGSTQHGRGALPDWLAHGFITTQYGRSVSRAVEYAANDYAVHAVAAGLGKTDDAAVYLGRSRNWRNHWNPNATSLGFSGFLVPRTVTAFVPQDPLECGGCYWADAYYEALPWAYSVGAHHDMETLVDYCGGPATFVRRLETMFVPDRETGEVIFDPGNEPSFATPYLFHFAGRPDLSVQHSRAVADAHYAPTPNGLPGNSDAGAMQSWLLWSMLGLYPLTGQTTFLIASPWLANTTVQLANGALVITAANATPGNIYVQSLTVNGQPWTQSWLTYDDVFARGGRLDFVLGPEPSSWARDGPLPPSPATEGAATTSTTTTTTTTTTKAAVQTPNRRTSTPLVVGLCVGFGGALLVVLAAGMWWWWRRRAARARSGIVSSKPQTSETAKQPKVKQPSGTRLSGHV